MQSSSPLKKSAPRAHKCTELAVRGNLPAATHYALQQRTSVVKGPRDPLRVISTPVTLWSAPVRTGAVFTSESLPLKQGRTGHLADWAPSQWTHMLSQQTRLPPPLISDGAMKQEDQVLAYFPSWHSWHVCAPRCASLDSSHLFSIFLLRWWNVRQLFYLYCGMQEEMSPGVMLRPCLGDGMIMRRIASVRLQTRVENNVRLWCRHLVAGCSKSR